MKKEGQIIVLYKYLLALIYMLVDRKMTDKVFMYEMGGGRYKDVVREKRLQKIIRKTSAFLVDSLS